MWRRCFSNSIPYLWCLLFKNISIPRSGSTKGKLNLTRPLRFHNYFSFHNINLFGFIFKCVSHFSMHPTTENAFAKLVLLQNDLIIRPHVKHPPPPPHKKFCSPMKRNFKKKVPITLRWRRDVGGGEG